MRIYLLLMAVCSSVALADEPYKDIFKIPYIRYTASAEGSLGTGSLDWSVAKDMRGIATPNILSELKFSSLKLLGHGVKGEIWVTDGVLQNTYLAMRAHHAAVNSGSVQDSDYAGNNRTGEYLRTQSDAVGDKVYEIDSELGYQITLADNFYFIPTAGLSLKAQRLRIGNPVTVIDTNNPQNIGQHHAYLDSSYNTRWEGFSIGGRTIKTLGDHEFSAYARYYRVNYNATANWNLRKDFMHPDSFKHTSDGAGYSIGARYSYHFSENWSGALELSRTKLEADAGEDRVNFVDGSQSVAQLNGVNWAVTSAMVGLEFHH
ncbi:MAG TPA: hypothetical protein VFM46_19855 [Pseudomonadales bacterium]|nr:hypothetical protein [Pseudomonadales bacterium]